MDYLKEMGWNVKQPQATFICGYLFRKDIPPLLLEYVLENLLLYDPGNGYGSMEKDISAFSYN